MRKFVTCVTGRRCCLTILFGPPGEGGLEVRGDGAGQAVPVDLHAGGGGGLGRHHPAGAHAVRRARAHRRAPLRDRVRHRQATPPTAALNDHTDHHRSPLITTIT